MTPRWQMTRMTAHLNKTRHCLWLWDASKKKKKKKRNQPSQLWKTDFHLFIWSELQQCPFLPGSEIYKLTQDCKNWRGDDVASLCFCDFVSTPSVFLNKFDGLGWLILTPPRDIACGYSSYNFVSWTLVLGKGAHASKLKKRNSVEFLAPIPLGSVLIEV